MPKKWSNKEWGNLLIILSLLFLVITFTGVAPLAIVGIETPVGSVKAEGISERSAVGLFIAFGLILIGAYLRFKRK